MIGWQKARFILRISAFYVLSTDVSYSWNLASLNVSDDALIWKLAVWRNRAFLAIPRTTNDEREEYRPTLIEVPWPEINLHSSTNVNTIAVPFSKNGPSRRNYETLISVTGLDVDTRGRLWILDAPDIYDRWPRIIIYDLKRNDRLVSSTELINVSPKHLKTLVVDSSEDQRESRGYMADAGDETIVVYSLEQGRWWKLRMSHGPEIPRVRLTDLAISRRDPILYVTGRDTHHLFSINLEMARNEQTSWTAPPREVQNVTARWLGKKLGTSVGLFCDLKGGLHYFMTSERASVRWDTKFPMNAENHSILVQNDDVPCIMDYAMDARRNVWGLVNSECSGATKRNIPNKPGLKYRTVRILKHSFTL